MQWSADELPAPCRATARRTRRLPERSDLPGGRREVLAVHGLDGPHVAGQEGVADVVIGHVEVARITPALAPRVAHDDDLLLVVVANGHDGVASEGGVLGLRHGHVARAGHRLRAEGRQHYEAEDEGETLFQHTLDILDGLWHARILRGPVRRGRRVAALRGPHRELRFVVLPLLLGAHADLAQAHDAVADGGPRILINAALHGALVVVDEEAAGNEVLQPFLDLVEVEGGPDGVGGAAAEVALVVEREVLLGAEVDLRRQALHLLLRPSQNLVPEIGKVSLPAHLPRGPHRDREAGLHHDERLIGSGGTAAANLTHFAGSLWVAMRT
mmetsp:Transcript_7149/g.20219  ORF Transcript_7149/g.20219 Transcript_7149/m.20219 type:complete len:328 (+) Transcript_7149:225-1208(+)